MKQISTYSKMNAHLLTHSHISRMALYAAFLFIGVLCSVGEAWGTRTYTAINDLSALSTGDSVIIAIQDGATTSKWWAMQVNTSKNLQGTYSTLTVSSNSVTNPNKTITWYVTKNAGTPTTYTFSSTPVSTTFYLCGKTDATDCQTTISSPSGSQKTTWYITQHSGIYFKLQLESSSGRVMCANNTTPDKMAVYTTSSTFVHQVTAKNAVCQYADELTIFKKETCVSLSPISGSFTSSSKNSVTVGWTIPVDGSSNKKAAGVKLHLYADNSGVPGVEVANTGSTYAADNTTTSHTFSTLSSDTKYWVTIELFGATVSTTTYCDSGEGDAVEVHTEPDCSSKYSFHYGASEGPDPLTVECFAKAKPDDATDHEWRLTDFTIPETNDFYVGYANATNGQSLTKAWGDAPSKDGVWQGQMHLVPYNTTSNDLENWGVGHAIGATGTINMYDNSSDKNQFVGFIPDGYGIVYGENSYAFEETASADVRETEVVTLPASLSTTYYIGLQTAAEGEYVKCAHSETIDQALSTMGHTSLEGGLRKIWCASTDDSWIGSDANMAIWDATHSKWGDDTEEHKFMTKVNDNLWYGYVPTNATTIILVRVDPDEDDPKWGWGQSYDITPNDVNNYITITGTWSKDSGDGNKDKAEYTIGSYHPTASAHGKFRMWDNNSLKNWCTHWIPYNKLTYNANGGSNAPADAYGNSETTNNVTVNNGSGLTAPDGKHFVKWNTKANGSGVDVASGSYTLTEDLEIYAIYEWTDYTVTVNQSPSVGSTLTGSTTTAHYGGTISISATVPDGYSFAGWTTSDGVTFADATSNSTSFTMPAKNVTVQANFKKIHTVTWYVNGSSYSTGVVDGNTYVIDGEKISDVPTAPDDETLNNCANKFMGWSATNITKGSPVTEADDIEALALFTTKAGSPEISANTDFYAVFAETEGAAVDEVMWSENWTGATTATSGSDVAKPSAQGDHSGKTTYGGASVTYNQTTNGTYVRNESNAGGSAPELMIKANEVWTVSGIPSGGATTLTVSYKQNAYSLTVAASGTGYSGSNSSSSSGAQSFDVTVGSASTFTLTFTAGKSSNVRVDNIEVKVKTTSYSDYVTICADNQVRVTYDANGGSTVCEGGVTTKNASYTICSTEPTRSYYDFGGWNDGTSTYNAGASYNLQATKTFTAQWTPTTYNITYELDGGTNDEDNPATYNITTATITLEAPTRNHDRFDGWFTDNGVWSDQVTEIPLGSHGDITLYAKWTARHTIIFDADGTETTIYRAEDENMESAVAGQGSKPSDPDAPSACSTKTFVGWVESEIDEETDTEPATLTNATGKVTADKHYYATWAIKSGSNIDAVEDNSFTTSGTETYCSMTNGMKDEGDYILKNSVWSTDLSGSLVKIKVYHLSNSEADVLRISLINSSGTEVTGIDLNTSKFGSGNSYAGYSSYVTLTPTSTVTGYKVALKTKNSNGTCVDKVTREVVATYSQYSTTCCASKVTLSDPSITDESSSGSTLTFDKSSPTWTCGGKTVRATLTLTAGYEATALSFTPSSGTVTIEPAISTPVTASTYYDITFSNGQTGTLTTTATIAAKALNSITITPGSGEVYDGQYVTFTVDYDPADYLSKGYSFVTTPTTVTKLTAGVSAQTQLRLQGGRGGVEVTSVQQETVSIKATGDNTKTASVDMTVNPLPRVHFADLVHGKVFADVVATIAENTLNPDKTTKTSVDWVTPNANTCEEKHLHLLGWIREDWPALVAYLNGTGSLPGNSAITSAGNDGSGNAYFFAPNASINVLTFDGVTFYAVWTTIE